MAKIVIDESYGANPVIGSTEEKYRISPINPISPVSRESDLKSSIKKYFLDYLETLESIPLFFEGLAEIPSDDDGVKLLKWVVISFGRGDLGNVSERQITLEAFTRNDSEGDDLSSLIDTIMGYILNEDSTNGLATIPYYDTSSVPWTVVGGIMPFLQPSLNEMEGDDSTKFKSINLLCKWGGK
jgi:hypothetical protein